MSIRSVGIVGAGLAGLACARTLAAHDVAARLLDKGRSAGGRMATRRVELDGTSLEFDHGAQYLTARGGLFRAALEASKARSWMEERWQVGVPRMSAIPRALAADLDIRMGREVVELAGGPGAWRLRHVAAAARSGQLGAPVEEDGPFDAIVLAIPAPQAAALLATAAPHLARVLELVRMAPCWTVMAAFAERLELPDMLRPQKGPLGWSARNSSKPGREQAPECWVLQANPSWSRAHLEGTPQEVSTELLGALAALLGRPLPQVLHVAAHRWRYALVEVPLGAPCLWEPVLGLGACGDWCIAARAEAAVESGAAMANIMASPRGRPV